jgi:cell wall assembly regulator SMI1
VSELLGLLRELERRWREKGSDDYMAMAPGLDRAEVTQTLTANGLRAPRELLDWYSWHNGVVQERASRRGVYLAPTGFQQLSLRECLEEQERWTQQASQFLVDLDRFLGEGEAPEMREASYWWEPTWLPIARSTGPHALVADLAGSSESVTVLIVEWSDMDDSREPRAESLADWVRLLLDVPDAYWRWVPSEDGTTGWVFDFAELPMEFRGRF